MQDFRDWRVLEGQATPDIYNLTDHLMTADVQLRGVAVNRSKQVTALGGDEHTFSKGRMETWNVGRVSLPPGWTQGGIGGALVYVSSVVFWHASLTQVILIAACFGVMIVN